MDVPNVNAYILRRVDGIDHINRIVYKKHPMG